MDRRNLSRRNKITVDGARLTRARINADMTVGEVASALDSCNKSSVSRWEQGILMPSEDRILKMVKLFGTADFVIPNPKYVKPKKPVEDE